MEDGLKRLAPIFDPIYVALKKKSRTATCQQAVVHILDPTRSAQVVEEHLDEVMEGILLVDRYSADKCFAKKHDGVVLAFCWVHARRDFIEAGGAYEPIAEWAKEWQARIDELFHRNRVRVRQELAGEGFRRHDELLRSAAERMHEQARKEFAEKPLHPRKRHVLKSLLEHWDGLMVFLDHPHIPMDNNASERTLRSPVVGRKNSNGSGAIGSARFTAVRFKYL